MMRKLGIWISILACLPMLSCDKEELATDLAFESAEVVGRDASRWHCGGGWFIATELDTFTVQNIPDQEIESLLENAQLEVNPPLKIWVVFDHAPTGNCATEFADRVKEIRAIQLRDD